MGRILIGHILKNTNLSENQISQHCLHKYCWFFWYRVTGIIISHQKIKKIRPSHWLHFRSSEWSKFNFEHIKSNISTMPASILLKFFVHRNLDHHIQLHFKILIPSHWLHVRASEWSKFCYEHFSKNIEGSKIKNIVRYSEYNTKTCNI